MNEHSDLLPNFLHEPFEMQMRGYSRRQVDDYITRQTNEIKDLEQRLARALDEAEHLRREISTVRQQALAGRPAHEEVSERIAQILKLADDEAKAQRGKADEDNSKLRSEAQQESERVRAEAREQAERMLTAAQEQAERTISAARGEADKMRSSARTEANRLTADSRKEAETALAEAKAQAKRVLDEATARATAIHDGAERRLNLLSTRHTETVRRLSDILEGVQGLVSAESARMSLEDEVNQSVSSAIAALEPPKPANGASTDANAVNSAGSPGGFEPPGTGPNVRPPRHGRPVSDPADLAFGSRGPAQSHATPAHGTPSHSAPDTDPVSALGSSLPGVPEPPATPGGNGPGLGGLSGRSRPISSGPIGTMPIGSAPTGTGDAQPPSSSSSAQLPPPSAMPHRLGTGTGSPADPGSSAANGATGSAENSGSTGVNGPESGSDPLAMPPLIGSIVPGPPPDAAPLPVREGKQDSNPLGHRGFTDPEDPGEGIRLMR
jgi:cell division septum initiation protein DivIVA